MNLILIWSPILFWFLGLRAISTNPIFISAKKKHLNKYLRRKLLWSAGENFSFFKPGVAYCKVVLVLLVAVENN